MLQRVAACCSVLQRVAACGSVWQRVAVCCSVVKSVAVRQRAYVVTVSAAVITLYSFNRFLFIEVLQRVAACCSVF